MAAVRSLLTAQWSGVEQPEITGVRQIPGAQSFGVTAQQVIPKVCAPAFHPGEHRAKKREDAKGVGIRFCASGGDSERSAASTEPPRTEQMSAGLWHRQSKLPDRA